MKQQKEIKFNYCIGSPSEEDSSTYLSTYCYGKDVQYGTMADAIEFKKYVESHATNKEWFIYKLIKVKN